MQCTSVGLHRGVLALAHLDGPPPQLGVRHPAGAQEEGGELGGGGQGLDRGVPAASNKK